MPLPRSPMRKGKSLHFCLSTQKYFCYFLPCPNKIDSGGGVSSFRTFVVSGLLSLSLLSRTILSPRFNPISFYWEHFSRADLIAVCDLCGGVCCQRRSRQDLRSLQIPHQQYSGGVSHSLSLLRTRSLSLSLSNARQRIFSDVSVFCVGRYCGHNHRSSARPILQFPKRRYSWSSSHRQHDCQTSSSFLALLHISFLRFSQYPLFVFFSLSPSSDSTIAASRSKSVRVN